MHRRTSLQRWSHADNSEKGGHTHGEISLFEDHVFEFLLGLLVLFLQLFLIPYNQIYVITPVLSGIKTDHITVEPHNKFVERLESVLLFDLRLFLPIALKSSHVLVET